MPLPLEIIYYIHINAKRSLHIQLRNNQFWMSPQIIFSTQNRLMLKRHN